MNRTTTQGIRYAEVERETSETCVRVVLDLDGGSRRDISTGLGFFDHMLLQFAFHGQVDFGVNAEGDLHIDDHHTVEDVGICLGRAIKQAILEDPITRCASLHVVMDDALVLIAMDITGRGELYFDVPFKREKLGDISTECIKEFFAAVAMNAGITVHMRKIAGDNEHHLCDALFKGFGIALHQATRMVERRGPSSTKGHVVT